MKEKRKAAVCSLVIRMALLTAVITGLFLFPCEVRILHGSEMYPFLRDGELVLLFRPGRAGVGSVVMYETADGKKHCGRIAGQGGDVIDIQDEVSLNGSVEYQTVPFHTPAGTAVYPYRISEDSFFILNDYRENVEDSRSFGEISRDRILGVVIFSLKYRDF